MEYGLVFKDKRKIGSIPLKGVDIKGEVIDNFSVVTLRQTYEFIGKGDGEVIYVFPLPDKSAVCGFTAKIGKTKIFGEVMERDLAYEKYDEAMGRGDSGFLLDSHRDNVFQISLGRIKAGEEVVIEIKYIEEIKTADRHMTLRIPTLVAPKYIPGIISGEKVGPGVIGPTDRVEDADYITPPIEKVNYMARISFKLNLAKSIESITSPSHEIQVINKGDYTAEILLSKELTKMDGDFILNVEVSEQHNSLFKVYNHNGDKYAQLRFVPELPPKEEQLGTNYIFVIDVSGSMGGQKLEEAKSALNICLRNLSHGDWFNIIAFESNTHPFKPRSLSFSEESLGEATSWINSLTAMGGTEIFPALKYALGDRKSGEKVVMLFTDGQVGNEKEMIKYVKNNNQNLRLYTLGIDTAVNTYFINEMAEVGNGFAEFVYPGENVHDKVIRQFARINSPWIDGLEIELEGVEKFEIAGGLPIRCYDLEETSLIMKIWGTPTGRGIVRGRCNDETIRILIDEKVDMKGVENIELIWARKVIEALDKEDIDNKSEGIKDKITTLSKKYGIISKLTSFVAVYEREIKELGKVETTVVPVSTPKGWEFSPFDYYDTFQITSFASKKTSANNSSSMKLMCNSFLFESLPDETMDLDDFRDFEVDEIKVLAGNQNFDGSFGDKKCSTELLKETISALESFAQTQKDIFPYRKQLKKAVDFIEARVKLIKDKGLIQKYENAVTTLKLRKIIK